MRQYSDDQEGFIPSDVEIRNKYPLRLAAIHPVSSPPSHKIRYRFSDHFIKKEHALALNTPLTLISDTPSLPISAKNKSKPQFEHPYKFYCCSNDFSLVYTKHSDPPFLHERQYMKHEVSLFNIEDKNSASVKELKSFQLEKGERQLKEDDLVFDSKMESGNLHCAFRRRQMQEYHLFMQNDTNTLGYNQWFYFALTNVRKNTTYSFRIVNYRKILSFFQHGQRIVLFSLQDAQQRNTGWRIAGTHYCFEQSPLKPSPQKKLFTLSFSIQFPHDNDYVCLASSLPYSYSKLVKELKLMQGEAASNGKVKMKVESVATTVCGNQVPEVTITSADSSKKLKDKKMIFILARQHPGEVWSSYVADGLMRALLKDTPEMQYILQNFIVKVFPMVNVDGVVLGNFRCDVTGVDLNRRWKQPSRIFHPHLVQIKKRLTNYSKKWKVQLCMDLHGHSKKYNVFCYSCKHNSYTCRILPHLIEKQTQMFHMPSCTFGLSKDKESTARATISKIIKSENVLTLETSAYGWNPDSPQQFHPIDLRQLALSICLALRSFLDKQSTAYQQAEQNIQLNFQQFKQYDQQNQEESGSDSEPEEDEIDFKIKLATVFDKKHQQEYRSFIKEDLTQHLHRSNIVFDQEPSQDLNKKKSYSSKDFEISQMQAETHSIKESTRKMPNAVRKNIQLSPVEEKQALSINHSDIGGYLNGAHLQIENTNRNPRNIIIRDKKRGSFGKDQKKDQLTTLNPRQLREAAREEIGRSSMFKEAEQEKEKRAIQGFLHKFERFIPSNMTIKNKGKFQALQEGLEHDDSSSQLNLMFENKRKLELQRIKKSIQESTEIVERQGKLKKLVKKEPIIDFKRFKQNEKHKQLTKRLGEISERYLQGQNGPL